MFLSMWRAYSNAMGVLVIAAVLTYAVLAVTTENAGSPVVIVEKSELLTPSVPVGGSFSFNVWRKSLESCPGAGVIAFSRLDPEKGVGAVISARYPLGSPGFNSPPPLVITRELPPEVTAGRWVVRTGVDSQCPTRTRYDQTGEFVLEVTP